MEFGRSENHTFRYVRSHSDRIALDSRVSELFQKAFHLALHLPLEKRQMKHRVVESVAYQVFSLTGKVFQTAFHLPFQMARQMKRNAGRLSVGKVRAIECNRNECLRRT